MDMQKIRVLYIDDEENNLQSFKALFRKKYEVFIAESGEEGARVLAKEMIHVILCDQRMPGMTGVEFFESILEKYPHPVRILLTGYTDIQAVIDAINKGQIYRFIDKPWDEQVISVAIQNAHEIYHTKFLLREQNIHLQKAYDELDKFVYSASHDLRAPLASILGLTKVAKSDDPENLLNYVDLIENTVNKMDLFVQNIIRYYRTNKMDFEVGQIYFDKILNEILSELEHPHHTENILINKDIQEPVFIRSDENRVRIILTNVLLNAIKFTDTSKGKHVINIDVRTDHEKSQIIIEDNGVGIEPMYQNEIFNMFYRGAHKNAGSGVGLYVVREALKKINGHIRVESEPAKGSRFIIEIPNILQQ